MQLNNATAQSLSNVGGWLWLQNPIRNPKQVDQGEVQIAGLKGSPVTLCSLGPQEILAR